MNEYLLGLKLVEKYNLSPKHCMFLNLVIENKTLTILELMELTGMSRQYVNNYMLELIIKSVVDRRVNESGVYAYYMNKVKGE